MQRHWDAETLRVQGGTTPHQRTARPQHAGCPARAPQSALTPPTDAHSSESISLRPFVHHGWYPEAHRETILAMLRADAFVSGVQKPGRARVAPVGNRDEPEDQRSERFVG